MERIRLAEGDKVKKLAKGDGCDDPGRGRDREGSLVHDVGERELEPQREDRESWIWNRRRGVEAREGLNKVCGEREKRRRNIDRKFR